MRPIPPLTWREIRGKYPAQWLVIEALSAHSDTGQRRLDAVAVVEVCPSGADAFATYRRLHREQPLRELYFVHTSSETLDIQEQSWVGLRGVHAA